MGERYTNSLVHFACLVVIRCDRDPAMWPRNLPFLNVAQTSHNNASHIFSVPHAPLPLWPTDQENAMSIFHCPLAPFVCCLLVCFPDGALAATVDGRWRFACTRLGFWRFTHGNPPKSRLPAQSNSLMDSHSSSSRFCSPLSPCGLLSCSSITLPVVFSRRHSLTCHSRTTRSGAIHYTPRHKFLACTSYWYHCLAALPSFVHDSLKLLPTSNFTLLWTCPNKVKTRSRDVPTSADPFSSPAHQKALPSSRICHQSITYILFTPLHPAHTRPTSMHKKTQSSVFPDDFRQSQVLR